MKYRDWLAGDWGTNNDSKLQHDYIHSSLYGFSVILEILQANILSFLARLDLILSFSLILSLDCIFAHLISNLGREEYFPSTVSCNLKLIQSTLEEIVRQRILNITENRYWGFMFFWFCLFFVTSLQLTWYFPPTYLILTSNLPDTYLQPTWYLPPTYLILTFNLPDT